MARMGIAIKYKHLVKAFKLLSIAVILLSAVLVPCVQHEVAMAQGLESYPEAVSKRTANTKHFDLGGNKYRAVISSVAVHYRNNYKDAKEQWKDIDLTWRNGRIDTAPYIAEIDGLTLRVTDKQTGKTATIALEKIGTNVVDSHAVFNFQGHKAVIKDFALDTDLEIEAHNEGIKFTRVLKSDKAALDAQFDVSGDWEVHYRATDADGDSIKVTTSEALGKIAESIHPADLQITWLDGQLKAVKYPIRIDPSLTIQPSTEDARIIQNTPTVNTGSEVTVNLRPYSTGAQRGLFKLSTASIPDNADISSVVFNLYISGYYFYTTTGLTVLCQRTTSAWAEGTVTWNTQPTVTTTDQASTTNPAAPNWMGFSVVALVEDAMANRSDVFSVLVRFQTESGSDSIPVMYSKEYSGYETYMPKLVVEYADPSIVQSPESKDFGTVAPSSTYWGNDAEPSWPLASGDCWGNLTNNSSFAIDIDAYAGNMTGGNTYTLVSGVPATDEFRMTLFKSGESDGAKQDYTTYMDEGNSTPPTSSHYSVASSTITYTGLTTSESVWVYKDFGADYFDENFHFYVDGYMSSSSDVDSRVILWAVTNDLGDVYSLSNASKSFLYMHMYNDSGTNIIELNEEDSGSGESDYYVGSLDTAYYLDIYRDESVGTYGNLTCVIYDSSAERATQTGAIDTLSIALHTSKKDYRYLYGLSSYNAGDIPDCTGWIANLIVFEGLILTWSPQVWISSLTAGNSTLWDLKFETWSSNSDGHLKTCIITFEASAS